MEHQSINDVSDKSKLIIEEVDDQSWMLGTGLNEETLGAAIESLVFVSEKPMSLNKIRDAISELIPLKTIHQAIQKLQTEYEQKNHGIRLQEVALGYQFRTKATYSKILQNHLKVTMPALTPATLEVLAIICYKQPISKTQIDILRGVDSSHLVKTLMDKKLITVSGRSEEEIGKPSLYATTSDFLEFFNLSTIDQLPTYAELEELAELDVLKGIPSVKEVINPSMAQVFDFDDLVEIDSIATKIKEIPVDTDFTKKLRNPVEETEVVTQDTGEIVKQTKHLSAYDILESFVSHNKFSDEEIDKDATVASGEQSANLLELKDEELDKLLDAAFEKLKDFEDTDDKLN